MQLLEDFLNGSLLSRKRLLEAREFYSPQRNTMPLEQDFARWSEKVAVQPELVSARELAGLSDDELCALDAEFIRSPIRRRSDRFKPAFKVGSMLAAAGVVGLAIQAAAAALGDGEYRALQVLNVFLLLSAACALGLGAFVAFSMVHLDLSHGKTGLYVGVLNEQHPWLYDTAALLRHGTADEYRQHVLSTRGPLRGVDFIIMRDIARAHDTLQRTEWARAVAAKLQQGPAPAETSAITEPRLVSVTRARVERTRATDRPAEAHTQQARGSAA